MKKKLRLEKVGNKTAYLELEIKDSTREVAKDWITLLPVESYKKISIVGTIFENKRFDSGGQNVEQIRLLYPDNEKIQRICNLWDEWHLNDMQSGTKIQQAFLKGYNLCVLQVGNEKHREELREDHYGTCCKVLREGCFYDDRGYKYGHGWLVKIPPQEVIDELSALFDQE